MNKDQLREHLKNAPPGTTPGGIVASLRKQGVQMEDDPLAPSPSMTPEYRPEGYSMQERLSAATPKPGSLLSNISESLDRRGTGFAQSIGRQDRGEQTAVETGVQLAGQGVGLLGDVIGEVARPVLEPTIGVVADSITKNPGYLGPLFEKIGVGMDKYQQWASQNPRAAADLEAVANISSILPAERVAGGVAGAGKSVLLKAGESIAPIADNLVQGAKLTSRLPQYAINSAQMKLAKVNASWANVPKDIVEMTLADPQGVERMRNILLENPANPYKGVAEHAANTLLKFDEEASKNFEKAINGFKENHPSALFDVSQSAEQILNNIQDMNLKIQPVEIGKDGVKLKVVQGKANPYDAAEIKRLTGLATTVTNAKEYTIDDLVDLYKRFDRDYNAIRLNEDGSAKPYHAAIMRLKEGFDTAMRGTEPSQGIPGTPGILPPQMQGAYRQLATAHDLMNEFGSKLLQGEGPERTVRDNAESFIKSYTVTNRGVRRENADLFKKVLGIDLTKEADLIRAAGYLSKFEPITAGRQGDILRSYVLPFLSDASGVSAGYMAGGTPGALLGAAAGRGIGVFATKDLSNPFNAGNRLIKAGKKAANRLLKP